MRKNYQRVDVNVFKDILKNKFCPKKEKGYSKKILLKIIQEINKVDIILNGLKINVKKEIKRLNLKEFGFKDINDIKIEVKEDVFENNTIITLKPKIEYELESVLQLPSPTNYKKKHYVSLMSDAFERIRIKAENIIDEVDKRENIELYATKNIQKAIQIFYEVKVILNKIVRLKDNRDKFFVYIQLIFIANTVLYLQNVFSAYYKEQKYSKQTLIYELWEAIGPDMLMEPTAEYGNNQEKISKKEKIKLLSNSNVIITNYYDLMNLGVIEKNIKVVEEHIYNNFLNKKGEPISKATINTCLKEYRTEKRVSGKNRIKIQTDL